MGRWEQLPAEKGRKTERNLIEEEMYLICLVYYGMEGKYLLKSIQAVWIKGGKVQFSDWTFGWRLYKLQASYVSPNSGGKFFFFKAFFLEKRARDMWHATSDTPSVTHLINEWIKYVIILVFGKYDHGILRQDGWV